MLRNKDEASGSGRFAFTSVIRKAENAAPALCFSVLTLLLFGSLSFPALFPKLGAVNMIAAVSLTAFLVPSVLFFVFFHKKASFMLARPDRGTAKFCIASAMLLVAAALLTKSIACYISGASKSDAAALLSGTDYSAAIICYAVLPAILEELVFRGVAFSMYEKSCGGLCAITATAFFFAMSHFSGAEFISYFISGLILGTVAYISRSIIPTIIMHLFNNFAGFYLENAVFKITSESKSGVLAIFLLAAISLLLLFWTLTELENICRKRYLSSGKTSDDISGQASFVRLLPAGKTVGQAAAGMIASPFVWAGILLFVVYNIAAFAFR